MDRANYIPAPHYFNLSMACSLLVEAYGPHVYLVGSSLERRDYRDVDVRCILDDDDFDRHFPGAMSAANPSLHALWSITCAAISLWLSQQSGLPIDFQIQRRTEINKQAGNTQRHPLGLFVRSTEVPDAR